ncbi:MAG: Flp pilus assembly complex ATPase component TadA [Balneolales bacterium]|nr:Flp pilus assembly complex ATPase component TadA [Balneolales bacterium]
MSSYLDHLNTDIFESIRSEVPDAIMGKERYLLIAEVLDKMGPEAAEELTDFVHALLQHMTTVDASDVDLGGTGCQDKIWYRVFGQKRPWNDGPTISRFHSDVLCVSILTADMLDTLLEKRNLDFSYTANSGTQSESRFRADMYFDLEHLALNMRKINNEVRPFKNLKLHPEVAKALSLKYLKFGLTLITGITGSGKSSTLDTIIDANNRSVDGHIVIISSPIEMIHVPKRCIVRHREVGRDTLSFKVGAIEALRQDPDIIVIGELRDAETIMTALEITDSGHKTFSTLHTASTTESIDRIIGEVPSTEQDRVRNRLADVLTCVISQKLVPTTDGKLVMAKEVLLNTTSIKAAIRNNNTGEIYQMLMEGANVGMLTLEQDLKRLYEEGTISLEEAYNQANNKKKLKDIIN